MHSTCTVRRGGRWQVAGWPRGQAQGGVASRLIDKCPGPVEPVLGPPGQPSSAPSRPSGRAPGGTYRMDAAEKRFSGHRSSQRKIGGGLPPLTPSTNRQPRHRRQSITTSRDTLDRFLQPTQTTRHSQCLTLSWHLLTPPSSSLMRVLRSPYEKSPAPDPTHHHFRDAVAYHRDVGRLADNEDHNRPTNSRPSSRLPATRSSPSGPLCSPRYDDQTHRPTYDEDPPLQMFESQDCLGIWQGN